MSVVAATCPKVTPLVASGPEPAPPRPVTLLAAGEAALSRLLLGACAQAGRPAAMVASGAAAKLPDGIVLDLTGDHPATEGQEIWRFAAADGGLAGRFALSGVWHRAPYHTPITLIRFRFGMLPETIAAARIGTTGSYRALREKAAATASILLRQALAGPLVPDLSPHLSPDSSMAEPVAEPPYPDGGRALAGGWLRWHAARWHGRLFDEWWTVGVCEQPIEAVLQQGRLGLVSWMRPRPGDSYWADPFAWPGSDRVLCEEYKVEGGPGVIAVLRPGADGIWQRERILLGDRLHRSYPFTYCEDGQVYLLPECIGGGDLVLHRMDAQGRTEPLASIARLPLADATLFRHDGRYWVAATDVSIGAHDNLCLFHAERLAGPWWPHRANPVKIDIRSCRPAGTPFVHDGTLFRPAQDCAAAYGAAVVVNRVVTLTTDDFLERPVLRLAPDPDGALPDGLHTLSAAGPRTLVDGKRMVFAPGRAVRRLSRRLRAAAGGGR